MVSLARKVKVSHNYRHAGGERHRSKRKKKNKRAQSKLLLAESDWISWDQFFFRAAPGNYYTRWRKLAFIAMYTAAARPRGWCNVLLTLSLWWILKFTQIVLWTHGRFRSTLPTDSINHSVTILRGITLWSWAPAGLIYRGCDGVECSISFGF